MKENNLINIINDTSICIYDNLVLSKEHLLELVDCYAFHCILSLEKYTFEDDGVHIFVTSNHLESLISYLIIDKIKIRGMIIDRRMIDKVISSINSQKVNIIFSFTNMRVSDSHIKVEVLKKTSIVSPYYHVDFDSSQKGEVVFLSSGSTGAPKLILFSTMKLADSFIAIRRYLKFNRKNKIFCHLNINFLYGISSVFAGLIAGSKIYLDRATNDIYYVGDYIIKNDIDSLVSIGDFIENISLYLNKYHYHLEHILSAADKLYYNQAVTALKITKTLWNNYGQTEAGPRILYSKYTTKSRLNLLKFQETMAVNKVINSAINIKWIPIDPKNKIYELWYQSPFSMEGYLDKRLQLIENKSNWIKSNDLFYRRGKLLFFCCRHLESLKINGKFLPLWQFNDFFIKRFGKANFILQKKGERHVECLIEKNNRVNLDEVCSFLKNFALDNGIIIETRLVDIIPRTESGKLKQKI